MLEQLGEELAGLPPLVQGGLIVFFSILQEDATLLASAAAFHTSVISLPVFAVGNFVGILVGDCALYFVGILSRRIRFLDRYARHLETDRAQTVIGGGLILTRFVPGSRVPTYILAGRTGFPLWVFTLILAILAALSIALYAAIGRGIVIVAEWLGLIPSIALGVAVLVLSYLIPVWLIRRRERKSQQP